MRVYLDNNIIVSIENEDYSINRLESLFPNQKIDFVYSSAHIFEVESFQGNRLISKNELLTKRVTVQL